MRALAIVFAAGAALVACAGEEGAPSGTGPVVVASVPPLAMVAEAVHVDPEQVSSFLPPGANPHAFEPSPADVKRAAEAGVLVTVGLGFDAWAERALEAAGGRADVRRIRASEGVDLIPLSPEETEAGAVESADPHVWLDPRVASGLAGRIAEALADADPAHAARYRERASGFARELEALDAELAATLAPVRGEGFVALHAAWAYFARRYGLVQGAVIELAPGREAGPRHLIAVAERAREQGLRAVLADVQLADGTARVVAEQAGLPVVRLDAQGGRGVPGREDYPSLLRWNAERLRDGLRGEAGPPAAEGAAAVR